MKKGITGGTISILDPVFSRSFNPGAEDQIELKI